MLKPPRLYLKVRVDQLELRDPVDGKDTVVHAGRPFSTARLLFGTFVLFEQAVKQSLAPHRQGWLAMSPVVIVQPLARNEGGLSEIERRTLQEGVLGAGASQAWVHEGALLSDAEVLAYTPSA